jgi:hypothetical protein
MNINFWTDGDRSVGLDGHSATVYLADGYDKEFIQAAKELLLPAFKELFDDGVCHCATDDEVRATDVTVGSESSQARSEN